ncbi:hypothetical protein RJ639_045548 [Escallonia herrerae]|uniref:STAS domain-containing protein n=1 Tax=Escallonia herrerae TaxID=1293975 RepID=A0AA89B3R4_9ASTE|nr:hypothetical protein RJ639_045548 [Escallonia herrerae]
MTSPRIQTNKTVTDIDTSGVHALEELCRSLQKRDVQWLFIILLGFSTGSVTFISTAPFFRGAVGRIKDLVPASFLLMFVSLHEKG